MGKRVLMIGLDPAVVNYDKWPELTEEKLIAALNMGKAALEFEGFEVDFCAIDHGETAAEVIAAALQKTQYDCIMIGAGVRNDPDEFLLFEQAINLVHKQAPQASICFNTGPMDGVAAVKRWL
ncbi:hypothetical protein L2725_00940 [Shewanella corallii]|uniref:Uncharacterized protein n=1 Tax=Shewanella corallii TaxID=560080 RepID=A0ABT0N1Y0_9GAMM|nr:hypothetical protein [Shewanella corallii]MCL2912360.1 hypothetical protein [Shewanella corallii]